MNRGTGTRIVPALCLNSFSNHAHQPSKSRKKQQIVFKPQQIKSPRLSFTKFKDTIKKIEPKPPQDDALPSARRRPQEPPKSIQPTVVHSIRSEILARYQQSTHNLIADDILNQELFDDIIPHSDKCPICRKDIKEWNCTVLSCGHKIHQTCFTNFRKFLSIGQLCCPICREPYVSDCVEEKKAAILIQKNVKGWIFRRHLGDHAPSGSIMHRKWVLNRAQTASNMLVDAIENQSNAVDAILASIDKELDWARTVMKSVEIQEKTIDWENVISKILQRGCGNCPICLQSIKESECVITSCEHCFHHQCLNSWLSFCSDENNATTCPVCRSVFQHRLLDRSHDDLFNRIFS